MKKERVISYLSFGILLVGISIFSLPKSVIATEDGKRYLGTTCVSPDKSWRCNDCVSGSSTCGDNSCLDCQPPTKEE